MRGWHPCVRPISQSNNAERGTHPGVFGYRGVTYDWWMATMAWNLDLKALKQLALNSIHHSSLPGPAQADLLAAWQSEWAAFTADEAAWARAGDAPPALEVAP